MGVSLGIDISKLDVCFGGFAPTIMGDLTASWAKAVEAENRIREHQEAIQKAKRLEAARESEPLTWDDGHGTQWDYVILDSSDVRIKKCRTTVEEVQVPSSIEGRPVVEVASDGCAFLNFVTRIEVPDSVVSLGLCVFRGDSDLRWVKLPAHVADFNPDWFRHCNRLEHLELPGALEVITARVFDNGRLKELVIGEGTRDIQPGAFGHSRLQVVSVRPDNPYMMTDGSALYSKDGAMMAALAVPQERYEVAAGCRALGKKAFSSFAEVAGVTLPVELEAIGEFAFAGTSIRQFAAPPRLRVILEKAFYGCRKLTSVTLNDGLQMVGPSAFEDTGLESLTFPSSIEEIGAHVADGTKIRFAGIGKTLKVEERSDSVLIEDEGGLYKKEADGLHFIRLIDPAATTYQVKDGTAVIGKLAFDREQHLEEVRLPEGLRRIEGAAFARCIALKHVNIPKSVTWIGGDAFLDTNLTEIELPAHLEHLGKRALVTLGAHHKNMAPSLRRLVVDPANQRFRMENGLLLERKADGAERVVAYVGPEASVRVPETVDEIAPYAFNGAQGITEMFLSDKIENVGIRGLAVDSPLDHIHVSLREPHDGRSSFDIHPPHTDRGEQQMMLAFMGLRSVDVEALFDHYDISIINASSFDSMSDKGMDPYDQAVRLIERLQDPVYMSDVNREMAFSVLAKGLPRFAFEMARHDDRASLAHLADLGVLDGENVDEVIESVRRMQDAAAMGYLLELKRERFGRRALDLSL